MPHGNILFGIFLIDKVNFDNSSSSSEFPTIKKLCYLVPHDGLMCHFVVPYTNNIYIRWQSVYKSVNTQTSCDISRLYWLAKSLASEFKQLELCHQMVFPLLALTHLGTKKAANNY